MIKEILEKIMPTGKMFPFEKDADKIIVNFTKSRPRTNLQQTLSINPGQNARASKAVQENRQHFKTVERRSADKEYYVGMG